MIAKLNDFELGWLIGIIEGESHINGKKCNIRIAMVDEDVVSKVAILFNRQYYKLKRKEPYQDQYYVSLCSSDCFKLLKVIYPHMSKHRQEQIELAFKQDSKRRQSREDTKLRNKAIIDLHTNQLLTRKEIGLIMKIPYSSIVRIIRENM